ncbi:MAG: guanosine-3',5'-bis(diphosphate) 3'-pyrophosphohydrolase [Acidobacteria bacterium]|nr:guanosine-3',5'-bis(diphosphate) 3'-pyrophosphohydrolase [Acidobacteriota bacterium]|tara:strand:- start:42117 stop:42578 length:462 start_codon:yes stop_codon:yes gene_type:complete
MFPHLVDKAVEFAFDHHFGQTDKAGANYIFHPKAVAKFVEEMGYGDEYVTVAWLHDVVEDCDVTVDEIREIFGDCIADAVDAVTKRKSGNEKYADYMARVKANPIATVVKLCDYKHNMDLSRLKEVDEVAISRYEKYAKNSARLWKHKLKMGW